MTSLMLTPAIYSVDTDIAQIVPTEMDQLPRTMQSQPASPISPTDTQNIPKVNAVVVDLKTKCPDSKQLALHNSLQSVILLAAVFTIAGFIIAIIQDSLITQAAWRAWVLVGIAGISGVVTSAVLLLGVFCATSAKFLLLVIGGTATMLFGSWVLAGAIAYAVLYGKGLVMWPTWTIGTVLAFSFIGSLFSIASSIMSFVYARHLEVRFPNEPHVAEGPLGSDPSIYGVARQRTTQEGITTPRPETWRRVHASPPLRNAHVFV